MPRGQTVPEGTIRIAQNGYSYTKRNGKWALTHHIIAEKALGRPIDTRTDGVYFKDGDKKNLSPSNIEVRVKGRWGKSSAARRARLEAQIEELQAQLDELDSERSEAV